MDWQLDKNGLILWAAAAVSFTVAFLILRRRHSPASTALGVVNLIGGLWALTAGLETASGTLSAALFFHRLSFLPMEAIGIAWWAFAASYVGREHWASRKVLACLSLFPLVTLILLWTNRYHGLLFASLELVDRGGVLRLGKTPGLWWWLDWGYTYLLLGAGFLLLSHLFLREYGLYRRQVLALCAGLVVPLVANVIWVFGRPETGTIDWAPAFFAWVGLVLYWGFARYQLLDLTPVAREFVAEHLSDALIVTDNQHRAVYANLAGEALLGQDLNAVIGRPLQELLSCRPGLFELYEEARRPLFPGDTREWEYQAHHYEGRVSTLSDGSGRVRGSILVLRDITARKQAEIALADSRQALEDRVRERTAELAAERERLTRLNTVAVEMARCRTVLEVVATGVRLACRAVGAESGTLWLRSRKGPMRLMPHDSLPTRTWRLLDHVFHNSVEVGAAIAEASPVCLSRSQLGLPASLPGETDATHPDQADPTYGLARVAVLPLISRGMSLGALCLTSPRPAFDQDPEMLPLAQAIASQIAMSLENVRRYEDAQFLADRDSLTGLLNHRGFSRRFEQEAARTRRSGSVLGLVMIDIDNFKLFNDTHGHMMGDQVLQQVAHLLTRTLRRSDIVARYGGDEFIAALPDTDAEAAVRLVDRVRTALRENPIGVGEDRLIPLKMSYGIATLPHDGHTPADLLAAADANLYRSKSRGGDFITASGSEDCSRRGSCTSFSVLDGLVTMVDKRDNYTRRHSEDVTVHALSIAHKMGLSVDTQRSLRIAGLLHDIGKLGVPDHILRKPAGLTEQERVAVQNHVTLGELIVRGIPNQEEVVGAIGSHHERWDGQGYPRGLKGPEIPLLGRILAITDAYSAMTTDRPYRSALSRTAACDELLHGAGTQFDPQVVRCFLSALEEGEDPDQMRIEVFASSGRSRT